MASVKYVIDLDGKQLSSIEESNASNYGYLLCDDMSRTTSSVSHLTREGKDGFVVKPWIGDLGRRALGLSSFPNGDLSIVIGSNPVSVVIYDANGSLMLSADIYGFKQVDRILQKGNGNLMLASLKGNRMNRVLTEFDKEWRVKGRRVYLAFQFFRPVGSGKMNKIVEVQHLAAHTAISQPYLAIISMANTETTIAFTALFIEVVT